MATDDTCRDVGALSERITAVETRLLDAIRGLTEQVKLNAKDIRVQFESHRQDMQAQLEAHRQDIRALAKDTQDQETRLVVVERDTERNTQRVEAAERVVSSHGRRLAQVGIVAVALSICLPVVLEAWLGQGEEPAEVR